VEIKKVLCERWIVVDDQNLRRSTWYMTPQEADKERKRLEELNELPLPS
jgi:hypothetical protein